MEKPNLFIQKADWKLEKHVPVIECEDTVKADEMVEVKVGIHIRWISLFFHPKDEKFPYHVGHFEFNAHGASAKGPNTSTIYVNHQVITSFKTAKAGTILALSLCNIHGLWQSSKDLKISD
jgi:superoxide reductase